MSSSDSPSPPQWPVAVCADYGVRHAESLSDSASAGVVITSLMKYPRTHAGAQAALLGDLADVEW